VTAVARTLAAYRATSPTGLFLLVCLSIVLLLDLALLAVLLSCETELGLCITVGYDFIADCVTEKRLQTLYALQFNGSAYLANYFS